MHSHGSIVYCTNAVHCAFILASGLNSVELYVTFALSLTDHFLATTMTSSRQLDTKEAQDQNRLFQNATWMSGPPS